MSKILITGGAGFIGSNAAKKFILDGHDVVIFDNLCRVGVEKNLEWLKTFGQFKFIKGDVRNFEELSHLFSDYRFDVVLHLAAQVAVTSSVLNPREDFESNALGAFNLLEAVRISAQNPVIIYSSTNKVYGGMENEKIELSGDAYKLTDYPRGIKEEYPLDFHSPYGCSKGSADQYFRDYSRIFNLRTVVFRQSCIYGYRQFGKEDQGWVAWFIIVAMTDQPMMIYGDGFQVRDILFVDDLIRAYDMAIKNINITAGQIYNIGGGVENSLSLVSFVRLLEEKMGTKLNFGHGEMRIGDQKIFISDNSKLKLNLGWEPITNYEDGIDILYKWIKDNIHFFKK
ncbi:MAG: CDP-paratose 2-epimerase [Parcubacteria group bacterium CG10_big_fil_rev_8_21_14_0_10_36_14]|nr:MAG: CDP-paratose 2-epimerase [Parcubacteria group bacterium CG10_big_fil_rev_8_21_14_0_10_36_14]